ncbi:glucose 1-dehydrogenase [Lysinibacillus irui]|uniref:Glucose 1-dehydrogenase n=1 Tax=Lysinibacillus irui TaxID=2998077 RepID=A0AAJ5UXE8_9BACI|nr:MULTISPECIES: glucose 1-dehydrogenase [Lysinibacillus]MEA0552056.1 glucose 1-dehydrogenase [Lysinibacillus irui]MEA0563218.1 glucose 1-dehydrogenase [Lysinibacillus irui]MEA0977981.1 glucose 1-dehydrogenase [Lysinibacillus irui]MEA1044135.1 glucose 1-dehydrogenase [Lysinibacillus irui]WDV08095.1 glucose 1-dehydrogenase [Lysinibacillus irui]
MRFQDKVVIVTGGASGLGEATALEFAKEGAKVAIADVADKGQAYSDELNSKGYDTIFVKTDVSKEDEIKNLVSTTVEKFGKLDVMFANAGINIEADVHDLDLASWQKVIDINLTSVFLSDKYAIEQFQKQGTGGVIINTGSIHSLVARDGLAPYSASKGGIKMLTQQVAARYSKEGIRANAIAPGYIETPLMNTLSQNVIDSLVGLHPMGRLGKPVEVAKTVLFLASDDSSFISGVTLPIDGGYTAV